jgi:tetratricopeptide (TPR) repeat protein
MAKRPSSTAAGDGGDGTITATEVPARARKLLSAGDLDGYRALFGCAEAVADPQRRQWARLSLVEHGLAAAASWGPAQRPELLAALAAGALAALERDPSEPTLLLQAAAVLRELGSLDGAAALLAAATRLDPREEALAGELAAPVARDGARSRAGGPAGSAAALADLARRAAEIAGRARPAEGLRLSLCMIVRDEQEMLPRCLETAAEAVDEIVIVDTGSTDATIEIARSFGARVIEHPWTGSFAEARNVSFDAASGDWLMYLDADEVLVGEDAALLRSLIGRTWREAFRVREINHTGELGDGTAVTHDALRILRNRPEYRFQGRVHEQIAACLPGYLPERVESTAVRIEHYGYLASVRARRGKSARNIELLRMEADEGPPSAFLHYNLGCEQAAAGASAGALAEFERSWRLLAASDRAGQEFAPALAGRLVRALLLCGRPEEAISLAHEALLGFPGFTDLVLAEALANLALGELDAAEALFERCLAMGDAPAAYAPTVGCGSYLPTVHLAELLSARGELARASELLEECLRAHPGFSGSVPPYVAASLASGTEPDAVVAALERLVPALPAASRLALGSALAQAGHSGAAEGQLRAVLVHEPRLARAHVELAQALLAQRRHAEAAAAAAALPSGDPLAASASRIELTALIAAGRATAAAFARARAASMSAEELGLFAAWERLARTGEAPAEVGAASVPLLGAMLEALLRAQDFAAFESLVALLEAAPLSVRERREMLAELYLRCGYAASAAEEWIAVCAGEPDARALLGLARVAAGRGMSREAGEFAAAALSRDPDNRAAARLLTQVQAAAT